MMSGERSSYDEIVRSLINEIGLAVVVGGVALQQARARRAAIAADGPPGKPVAA